MLIKCKQQFYILVLHSCQVTNNKSVESRKKIGKLKMSELIKEQNCTLYMISERFTIK